MSENKKGLPVYAIKLKRFRLSKGLTQEQFGELIGKKQITVASYEQGIRRPKEKTMQLMKEKIGLDIYEVFFNEELEILSCQK